MQSALLPLRPRTSGRFASLMELYERNYMLVRLLAPGLRTMATGEHVSRAGEAMPLLLDRIEHGRYTTTFNLTYRFSSRHRDAREPDLSIRLYHDARTCEVMSGLLPGERRTPRRRRDLDEGWRLNRFLHRWLGYCLRQGHGFGGVVDDDGGVGEVDARPSLAPSERLAGPDSSGTGPVARRGVSDASSAGRSRGRVSDRDAVGDADAFERSELDVPDEGESAQRQ